MKTEKWNHAADLHCAAAAEGNGIMMRKQFVDRKKTDSFVKKAFEIAKEYPLIIKPVKDITYWRSSITVLFLVLLLSGSVGTGYADHETGSGPLRINEVVTACYSPAGQTNGSCSDWVELKNISAESICLSEYYLTDTAGVTPDHPGTGKKLYRLPETELLPGEMTVIYCSDDADDAYHTGFGLDSGHDELYLYHENALVDYVDLKNIPVNGSCGRETDEQFLYYTTPSPGMNNTGGCSFVSAKPEASLQQGMYAPGTVLAVGLTGNGTIYYTLDGSQPTETSSVYTAPLSVSETTVIRAVCKEPGGALSATATFSYILDESTMPVISLVVDDYDRFVYTYDYINVNALNMKETEFPSEITYFDGEDSFTMPCGLRMRGYTSLNMGKKSMAVYFRDRYGKDTLRYDVFGNGIDKYSSLCLRAGQDYNFAYIRDELMQELCLDMDANVATQESKYCVLFVNGEYWGMFCLKEDFSSQYFASHYGISKSSVEREKAPFGQNTAFYNDVFKYALNNKVYTDEGYAYISSVLDIDSLIDWIILEGVSGNTDTVHNCAVFRSEELDGKWRMVFYDLDWSFCYEYFDFRNILLASGNASWDMMVLSTGLLKNEEFRTRFLTRFAEVNTTVLSTENILAKIDELVDTIRVEATRDTVRWTQHSETSWLVHVENMKNLIINYDWSNHNREELCELVDGAEEFFEEYGKNSLQ